MRPFRFLGIAADGIADGRRLADTARRAESLGYSGLVLPDHLVEQLAPIPALATVAAVTDRVRIGTFVANVDLRHPAVVAQDFASLDVLSGAGWRSGWAPAGTGRSTPRSGSRSTPSRSESAGWVRRSLC